MTHACSNHQLKMDKPLEKDFLLSHARSKTCKGVRYCIPALIRPKTIRYAGSKRKILPKIELITKDLVFDKVLDGFSGSGIVSLFFKTQGKTVHSNDQAVYSKCIAETFLLCRENKDRLQQEIDYLNSLPPVEG